MIEVDGSIHNLEEIKQNDRLRQQQLEREGLFFLRFSNDEIKLKPQEVIQKIENYLKENAKANKNSQT